MKNVSPGLRFTLLDFVGTRTRFVTLLLFQGIGFVLSVRHLPLDAPEMCNLAFWGLVSPLIFLVTLRQTAVQMQKEAGEGKPSACEHN